METAKWLIVTWIAKFIWTAVNMAIIYYYHSNSTVEEFFFYIYISEVKDNNNENYEQRLYSVSCYIMFLNKEKKNINWYAFNKNSLLWHMVYLKLKMYLISNTRVHWVMLVFQQYNITIHHVNRYGYLFFFTITFAM